MSHQPTTWGHSDALARDTSGSCLDPEFVIMQRQGSVSMSMASITTREYSWSRQPPGTMWISRGCIEPVMPTAGCKALESWPHLSSGKALESWPHLSSGAAAGRTSSVLGLSCSTWDNGPHTWTGKHNGAGPGGRVQVSRPQGLKAGMLTLPPADGRTGCNSARELTVMFQIRES